MDTFHLFTSCSFLFVSESRLAAVGGSLLPRFSRSVYPSSLCVSGSSLAIGCWWMVSHGASAVPFFRSVYPSSLCVSGSSLATGCWWTVSHGTSAVPIRSHVEVFLRILTLLMLEAEHSGFAGSIPGPLMPWLLNSPRHQPEIYWEYRIGNM